MIKADGHIFVLETAHTTYCFRRMETGHLEHLYYGRRLTLPEHPAECDVAPLVEKHTFAPGNTNLCDGEHPAFSLEDMRLEMSSYGKGDIREPFVEIVHADGSTTSDFHYESYEITEKTAETENGDLPGAYDERGEAQRLCIRLRDHSYDLVLELHYDVYAECDAIVRSAVLFNESKEMIRLNRLMSTQIDFDPAEYVFTTFTGAWAREMHRSDTRMEAGKHVNASYTGTSSSRANPFVMIAKTDTTEDTGECYGCNLIYSGNHYEAAEVSGYGKMRLTAGINPQSFSWLLATGENFAAPEAVMAYSCEGYNGMSQCMHAFVREHIVRGAFKHKVRPVLLNSWEAAYFDINERKLLALAKKAKEAGVELFVMDDGWFGERNDDAHSLGDWEVNEKKLPGGLAGLGRKIKALGLDFGIWVEPEMVNVNSHLYQAHPDWTIEIPGKPHAEGRNQRILDLTRTEVQDYIIETMTKVFSSAEISYVKWDMNRSVCDVYSHVAAQNRNGELYHRYVLGVYDLLERFLAACPDLLLEGCSGGGGRYDAGMMYYSPQIWCSDNTDAINRLSIQYGSSFFYPISTVGSHVSVCPNHQTGRVTPFRTRGDVALAGSFGYEMDLNKISEEEKEMVKEQVAAMHEYYELTHEGLYYRLTGLKKQDFMAWEFVAKDQSRALLTIVKTDAEGNMLPVHTKVCGLAEDKLYRCSLDQEVRLGRTWNRAGLTLHQVLGEYESIRVEFTEVK